MSETKYCYRTCTVIETTQVDVGDTYLDDIVVSSWDSRRLPSIPTIEQHPQVYYPVSPIL